MSIPLEDGFTDIIHKARRGHGLSDEDLAAKAGVTMEELIALKDGTVDAASLRKLASALSLNADALVDLAEGEYKPAPVEEIDGLARFNSAFDDMTVNAYLIWDPATREAAIFDTGADAQPMIDLAKKKDLKVTQIFLTHIHGDHIYDLDRLKEKTKAPAYVCELEPLDGAQSFALGKSFTIGHLTVETRQTSGHATGGVTFFVKGLAKPVAVVGDAIFAGSMGGGMVSYHEALRTNRDNIYTLPDETILCPGHGPYTTVGEQKVANPFYTTA